jgi:hypothetical protein
MVFYNETAHLSEPPRRTHDHPSTQVERTSSRLGPGRQSAPFYLAIPSRKGVPDEKMHEGAKKVMRTRSYLNGTAVFACLLGAGAAGCISDSLSVYTCSGFETANMDAVGQSDPCHDPPADLDGCSGRCVPRGADGWPAQPSLVWVGPRGQAPPPCPHGAPDWGYAGYTEISAPGCQCTCERPDGSCTLPSTLTAYAAVCQDPPQGQATPFDAPANWNGSCSPANPIQQGALCGGVPCVQSLSVDPLVVTETGCTAVGPTKPEPRMLKDVHSCVGGFPLCEGEEEGRYCVPAPPPEFHICISLHGTDVSCPPTYPVRYIFYENDDFIDSRLCGPCSCGAPEGSVCSAFLSVYKNSTCSTVNPADLVVGAVPIASTGQGCVNILPAGQALGSKEITNPTYQPGTCTPSGGETMGSADPLGPASTYCCLE